MGTRNRFSVARCCCNCPDQTVTAQVLLWDTDCHSPYGGNLAEVKTVLEDAGATCHYSADYSGTLADYDVIIWTMAEQNPSWWGQISGGTWSGRILITAEFSSFSNTITYVDGISSVTGISVTSDFENPTAQAVSCDTEDVPLAYCQPTLRSADTSIVSGGTAISYTCGSGDSGSAWIMENTVGNISFVVSGDASFLGGTYHITGAAELNKHFIWNLCNVAV